jgi:hypothetical protein
LLAQVSQHLGTLLRRKQPSKANIALHAQRLDHGGILCASAFALSMHDAESCHHCARGDSSDPAAGTKALEVVAKHFQASVWRSTTNGNVFLHFIPIG